ncbi:hypothetical protein NX059_006791 [Plenodomus lindquistii]|nr:hypothetical protein NX059_006791 [Plenodomus lindquistii]
MHGKAITVALLALAAGASAQTPIAPNVQESVLSVLATAIPSEVASYAVASPTAFAGEMASSLAAGKIPAWYQALPTDVLSLLPQVYPYEAEATPTPSSASASASAYASASKYATSAPSSAAITPSTSAVASAPASIASGSSALTGVNSVNSTSRAVQSPTLSTSASAATFTGAACFPTAAVGASVGAIFGFLGMLAL